ncbi:hypothetical protein OAQ99_05285 [Candidatus Kapabacteria bacterium]|nr:hypothetical protein [Candidatus Kapabacteria bacterium]
MLKYILIFVISNLDLYSQIELNKNINFLINETSLDSILVNFKQPQFEYLDWSNDLIDMVFIYSISLDRNFKIRNLNIYPLWKEILLDKTIDSNTLDEIVLDLYDASKTWVFKEYFIELHSQKISLRPNILLVLRICNNCHHDLYQLNYNIRFNPIFESSTFTKD